MAFGSTFFLIGLFAFWMTFVIPLSTYLSARNWQQIPCTILTSNLEQHHDDDGTTYKAAFTYEYRVAGVRYVGKRDNTFNYAGSHAAAIARQQTLPVGTQTVCWVNPTRPDESLLDRSIVWTATIAPFLFLICFCGLGGGVAYFGLRTRQRQRRDERFSMERPPTIATSTFQDDRVATPALASKSSAYLDSGYESGLFDGHRRNAASIQEYVPDRHAVAGDLADQRMSAPQRLKPEKTRIARFLVMLVVAILWNGVVSLFVKSAIFDPPAGTIWARVGFGLFLVPFVLVGLAAVGGCVHTLLSLFNPSVSVALSTGAAQIGSELDIAWEVRGGWRSLQRLKVVIIGQEWCRYVQGTDTKTDTSPFAALEICNTSDPGEIQFGSCAVVLPAETMHSFEADNNKIQWVVRVQGEIPWWPNLSEDFPFRVTPPSIGEEQNV